jgi:hypothetical protein
VPSGRVPAGPVLAGPALLVEPEGDTVALLHEHARRVAREARRAEGTGADAGAREGLPAPGPTGDGRPRSTEPAVAGPSAAVRAAPSPDRPSGPAVVGAEALDDHAIEELNAARWTALRHGPWHHRPSA